MMAGESLHVGSDALTTFAMPHHEADWRRLAVGLVGLVRSVLRADPLSPTFFVFFDKDRNKINGRPWPILNENT